MKKKIKVTNLIAYILILLLQVLMLSAYGRVYGDIPRVDILFYLIPLISSVVFFVFNFYLKIKDYYWNVFIFCIIFSLYFVNAILLNKQQESKIYILNIERIKNKNTYLSFLPTAFVKDPMQRGYMEINDGEKIIPLSDISNTRNIYCKEGGDYLIYQSDEKGFNNPSGTWSFNNKRGVVFIGDSYIHGACVVSERGLISKIRENLPGAINLGRGGNGPLANLAILMEYGLKNHPEKVVWAHSPNDLLDLNSEVGSEYLMKYLTTNKTHELYNKTDYVNSALINYENSIINKLNQDYYSNSINFKSYFDLKFIINKTISQKLIVKNNNKKSFDDYYVNDLKWKTYEKIIVKARNLTEADGGLFIVAILPFQNVKGYLNPDIDPASKNYLNILKEIYSRNNIKYFDLNVDFSRLSDPNKFYTLMDGYYGHPNDAGYAYEANLMIGHINSFSRIKNSYEKNR